MNLFIYDCEILKMIPQRNQPNDPKYQYCNGWTDYKGMRASVLGAAIVEDDEVEYRSFVLDRMTSSTVDLDELDIEFHAKHSPVVGFNSLNFDDKLMAAHGINIKTDYDLLDEVRLAAYGSTDYRECPKGRSYKLGKIGEANGFPKTGNGEMAPKMWQDGRHQEVIDYCLNDVRIVYQLLKLGLAGQLVDPNTNGFLQLRALPVKGECRTLMV